MHNYAVDLEIAKELNENGFFQETEYYFVNNHFEHKTNAQFANNYDRKYSAPTSDEILKELPSRIISKSNQCLYFLTIYKSYNTFHVAYYNEARSESLTLFNQKQLSNGLAKMWLYLKKEGYIK